MYFESDPLLSQVLLVLSIHKSVCHICKNICMIFII